MKITHSPRIVILQHSKDTPPGSTLEWLETKGYRADIRRLYAGDELPNSSDFDWLIILGGPMNVDDLREHPWLSKEKALLKQAITEKKSCLGLCLGGQLLAQVLGARVAPHSHWEVGWHQVQVDSMKDLYVYQWHQDAFDLPSGAIRIASNSITRNQGFAFEEHVIGLQFHPEATEDWVKECSLETPFPEGPYVQGPGPMLEGLVHLPAMKTWYFRLLDRMETRVLSRRAHVEA